MQGDCNYENQRQEPLDVLPGVVEMATAADDVPNINQVMNMREAIPLNDDDWDTAVAADDGISPVPVSKSMRLHVCQKSYQQRYC